jgi:ribose/xylose/arabinose/galactoside ABC-type transport system permease subunit
VTANAFWRRHETSLMFAILMVAILTTLLDAQHNYWTNPRASLIDLTRQWSMLSLFALGSAIVIIAGGIDLSTGSVIAFSGTFCATLLLWIAPEEMTKALPLPMWVMVVAIAGTLLCGFLIGSLHAWLITVIGLPPFVATLATLVGLRSLARAMCEAITLNVLGGMSTQISLFDRNLRYLAQSVWIPMVLVIGLSILCGLLLSRTVYGRHLYALGGNEQAARLSGIRTDRLKWLAYSISSMLASCAGILYICEQSVADPQTLGRGYELNAIAAAVVGGCSLQGGVGTISGTLLGALFLRTVIDGVSKIIKTGADVYEGLIVGVVVVFAVVFTQNEATARARRSLFAGPLGVVTIINMTLVAGALMALIGVRLLTGVVTMNTLWLANFTMLSVATLLCLSRWMKTDHNWRRAGIAWAIATIVGGIGLDVAYPNYQLRRAMSTVSGLGGKVVSNEAGLVVDLQQSPLTDDDWRGLASNLALLPNLAEVRLNNTAITDRTVDTLARWDKLKSLDLRHTATTPTAIQRLQRKLPQTKIASGQ